MHKRPSHGTLSGESLEQTPSGERNEPNQTADIHGLTPCYPVVAERAEWSEIITLYDRQHIVTYARLLDAERDRVDWRDGVREILLQDPEKDPRGAQVCWESHLERARWIATVGFQQAVDRARAQ